MSDPQRHHYLPEFCQKAWMGPNNKVKVFRRVHGGRLDVQCKARKSVGWEKNLYADLSEDDPIRRQRVERAFMKKVDDLAAEALFEMLSTGAPPVTTQRANAWARFLMSLLHRHPARVALLREMVGVEVDGITASMRDSYSSLRAVDDPESFDDYVREKAPKLRGALFARLVPMIIDSERIGNALLSMTWAVGVAVGARFNFMSSDRPLMTSDGLGRRESFLVLPISPRAYFIAASRKETIRAFKEISADGVIHAVNHAVCVQAEHFVVAADEAQMRFVDNRLGGAHRHPVVRDSRGQIFWDNPCRFDPWQR